MPSAKCLLPSVLASCGSLGTSSGIAPSSSSSSSIPPTRSLRCASFFSAAFLALRRSFFSFFCALLTNGVPSGFIITCPDSSNSGMPFGANFGFPSSSVTACPDAENCCLECFFGGAGASTEMVEPSVIFSRAFPAVSYPESLPPPNADAPSAAAAAAGLPAPPNAAAPRAAAASAGVCGAPAS